MATIEEVPATVAMHSATSNPPASNTVNLKGPSSPLPPVLSFDADKCTSDELIVALKTSGGVIIRNFLTAAEIGTIEADVRPWLDKDKHWDGDFFPKETRRAFGLVGKSKTFALRVVGHELWLEVCDGLLMSELKGNWIGDKQETSVAQPQLNNTVVFSIGPGAQNQILHRDDQVHHRYLPAVASHEVGRDAGIGLFVAGKKATRQNGATRFIPGSHLWDYSKGPPREDQTFHAELNPGDAFMMLSGCFHGGSANKTTDEERLLFSCFYTRSWMRQEENQYLANDIEKVKELPIWLQERIGWSVSRPFLGWVDLNDPMRILRPEIESHKDLI